MNAEPFLLHIHDLLHHGVAQNERELFDKLPIPEVRLACLARASFGGYEGGRSVWAKERVGMLFNKRDPFFMDLLRWYVSGAEKEDVPGAVDFAISVWRWIDKINAANFANDKKAFEMLAALERPKNEIVKMIVARLKDRWVGNATYWGSSELFSFFDKLLFESSLSPYSEEDWTNIVRVVDCVVAETDMLLYDKIEEWVMRPLKDGSIKPHESMGPFAPEDHLHFLKSRMHYILHETAKGTNSDFAAFYEAIRERARISLAPTAYWQFPQKAEAGKKLEIGLHVEGSLPQDNAKIRGALANFKVDFRRAGFLPIKGSYTDAFSREDGVWRLHVVPRKGSNRLLLTVRHGSDVLTSKMLYILGT